MGTRLIRLRMLAWRAFNDCGTIMAGTGFYFSTGITPVQPMAEFDTILAGRRKPTIRFCHWRRCAEIPQGTFAHAGLRRSKGRCALLPRTTIRRYQSEIAVLINGPVANQAGSYPASPTAIQVRRRRRRASKRNQCPNGRAYDERLDSCRQRRHQDRYRPAGASRYQRECLQRSGTGEAGGPFVAFQGHYSSITATAGDLA